MHKTIWLILFGRRQQIIILGVNEGKSKHTLNIREQFEKMHPMT